MADADELERAATRPLTADGAEGAHASGGTAQTWQVLLDAQLRVEESATALRQNLMITAGVLALATLILERFLFLTGPERLLVAVLPIVLLVAGGAVDLLWYDRRVRRFGDRIEQVEAEHPDRERLQQAREQARGRSFPRLGVVLYYLVPILVLGAVLAWRLA